MPLNEKSSGVATENCPAKNEADPFPTDVADVHRRFQHTDRTIANRRSIPKRILDYAVCIPVFLLTLPLFILVYLAIKISDRGGPAFFVQQREGIDGQLFPFYKFRTMYVDADARLEKHLAENPERKREWETIYKLSNDPRVLPLIGNFLRRTSLDELPNLFNILRGEMSLVGPRPFPQYHLDDFDSEFREKRASVWPGLTGLWQIHRGGLVDQKRWDEKYIDSWSFASDVKIFLTTIPMVLFGRKDLY